MRGRVSRREQAMERLEILASGVITRQEGSHCLKEVRVVGLCQLLPLLLLLVDLVLELLLFPRHVVPARGVAGGREPSDRVKSVRGNKVGQRSATRRFGRGAFWVRAVGGRRHQVFGVGRKAS